jgi:hypothetical protein
MELDTPYQMGQKESYSKINLGWSRNMVHSKYKKRTLLYRENIRRERKQRTSHKEISGENVSRILIQEMCFIPLHHK